MMTASSLENISDAIFHHAAERPRAPALIVPGRSGPGLFRPGTGSPETVSYGALATLVGQAALYLRGLGIKAGDRVGLALDNSVEHVVLSLATLRVGAVRINLPLRADAAALVARFAITAIFVEPDQPASPAAITARIDRRWRDDIARLSGDARHAGDPDELRTIIPSSGSTGTPKGLVTTQRQLIVRSIAHMERFGDAWSRDRPGTLLLPVPPDHSMLAQFLIIQLLLGGPVALLPPFRDPRDLTRELAAWNEGICPVPPGIARRFLDHARYGERLFPRMRALIVGGQQFGRDDKLALIERVTPHLYDIYGCAGFGMISLSGPDDIAARPDSVGRPVSGHGAEFQIVGPDGEALPPGAIGQARMRGPTASLGFDDAADTTPGTERFADGWYYPGEIATLDADGYLFLKGRIADAIRIGSSTIYPPEIEAVLTAHPSVADAAVIGRPRAGGGEELIAFVVGRPGFRHEEIVAHCRGGLPSGRRPRMIYYVDALPRIGNGKIDRRAIRVAAARHAEVTADAAAAASAAGAIDAPDAGRPGPWSP